MSAISIYHYNRCSKSRQALSLIEEKGLNPQVREYLKDVPSEAELKEVLKKLDMKAEDLVRKTEKSYKENYKGKNFSEEEWIKILVENPRLIQRPIVIKGDKAVIGRPLEKVEEIL